MNPQQFVSIKHAPRIPLSFCSTPLCNPSLDAEHQDRIDEVHFGALLAITEVQRKNVAELQWFLC